MPRPSAAGACRSSVFCVAIISSLLVCVSAVARTLEVGPATLYRVPSAAIAAGLPADSIEFAPGTYSDCAVLSASRLTVIGKGPGVVLAGKTCQGKAILVTRGDGITIENITFARARVPDQNRAGIRVEGRDLTIVHCRFIDNKDGILAGSAPGGRLLVRDNAFLANGKCAAQCAHGLYVGHIALLRVEYSRFARTKEGRHIKSRALRTELIDNVITDGPNGTASYLVDVSNGGSVVMENNVLEKGPKSSNYSAAIVVGAEGVTQPTDEFLFKNNRFTNDNEHSSSSCAT
jgi:Right handed beta helix region